MLLQGQSLAVPRCGYGSVLACLDHNLLGRLIHRLLCRCLNFHVMRTGWHCANVRSIALQLADTLSIKIDVKDHLFTDFWGAPNSQVASVGRGYRTRNENASKRGYHNRQKESSIFHRMILAVHLVRRKLKDIPPLTMSSGRSTPRLHKRPFVITGYHFDWSLFLHRHIHAAAVSKCGSERDGSRQTELHRSSWGNIQGASGMSTSRLSPCSGRNSRVARICLNGDIAPIGRNRS